MKGLAYRFRAARNATSSRFGPCEDWVVAMLSVLPEVPPAVWDRFALSAREFESADLLKPWQATLARAEALAEKHARGRWWANAEEATARLAARPTLDAAIRLNRRATELNMTIGLSSALDAAGDLGQIVVATTASLTVRDLQSESDRQLLYLPVSQIVSAAQLSRFAEQARELRAQAER